MKIKCPACSKVLNIPDSAAGKIVKCPCGKQLRAPGSAPQGLASSAPAGAKPGESRPASGNPAATRPVAGPGEFDAAMFDDLTDQDLKPVKGVVNPYTPVASPAAGGGNVLKQYSPRDGVGGQGRREIAGVGSRILGAIVDALFVNLFVGIGVGAMFAILPRDGAQPSPVQLGMVAVILGVAVLIPVIVNAVLITKSGQSLGKKAVGTRMVDQQTGAQVGFVQGYLVRSFAFGFLTGLPVVGAFIALADIIFLFTENHQTLHDRLAKTLVVKA